MTGTREVFQFESFKNEKLLLTLHENWKDIAKGRAYEIRTIVAQFINTKDKDSDEVLMCKSI
jgi:hypothetical protein